MIDYLGEIRRIQNKDVNETFSQTTDSLEAIRDFLAAFSGEGLCYYGIVTAIPGANQFTIPTLAGLGAGKFIGPFPYRAFVLRDAGGGVAPQSEMQRITAYAPAAGNFTTLAFGAAVAVNDEILLLHPRIAEIFDLVGSTTNIFNLVNAILVATETGGTLTTDGTEQNVYVNNNPAGVYEPLKVMIDFTNQTAGETVRLRTYYRIRPAGNLRKKDDVAFAGVQDPVLINIELEPNRYGIQVTMQRTAGMARDYDWEATYRA